MQRFVVLLRGINVGGHNKLPMADLRAVCESLGFKKVQTYIQSGNIVLDSEKDPGEISSAISQGINKHFGFEPKIMTIPAKDLKRIADKYSFATDNHKLAHIMFLDKQPEQKAADELSSLNPGPDKLEIIRGAVLMYFPNGILESKINLNKIERVLGVNGTARNWRTVQKLVSMAL